MFSTILKYELRYWFKQSQVYLYALFFLGLSTLYMAGTLGVFGAESISDTIKLENSPLNINIIVSYFTLFVLFLLPTIIGNAVYRDFKSNMHTILYSYPFAKRDYLFAKFLSSFIVVVGIVTMVGVGLYIGTLLPGIQTNKVAPFNFQSYLQAYIIYVIPNIFLYGTIVFAIVTFSRNIYAGFIVVGLLMFVPQLIKNVITDGYMLTILDPFGDLAVKYSTQYWTITEQNQSLIPISEVIIFNRLLWSSIALSIFCWVYQKFSFSQNKLSIKLFRKDGQNIQKRDQAKEETQSLSSVRYSFSTFQHLKTVLKLSTFEFNHIIKSWPFITILTGGLVVVFFMLMQMNPQYENAILPTTWLMLRFPVLFFSLVVIFITFLYSGILIHRPHLAKTNHIIDVTPTPNWVFLLSKFVAIVKIQVILLSTIMVAGITTQVYKGYHHFEIWHYIFELYVLNLIVHIIWAFASFFVHTLINHLYIGLFILLVGFFGVGLLPEIGIEHPVFIFNSSDQDALFDYTDMNGYGSSLYSYFIYKSYWVLAGTLLLICAQLFWIRGIPYNFLERIRLVFLRFKGRLAIAFISVFLLFISMGSIIYYETAVRNLNLNSDKVLKKLYTSYEDKYSKYEHTNQPRIVSLQTQMNIYPEDQEFDASGSYCIVNKSNKSIDTLLVQTGFDEITTYTLDKNYQVIEVDSTFKFSILLLKTSMKPGDSLILTFSITNQPNTLFQQNSSVLKNGTFIGHDAFPRLGYKAKKELMNPTESRARNNSYQSSDSDLIEFEAIVSTCSDQTAISPGYLQKVWLQGDRKYFHYKMDEKIKFNFSFNSGRYSVLEDKWNDVSLKIYYHRDHHYNLESMMKGMKASLSYNSYHFGPYQHKEARIIEFPVTRGSFATVFGNSIPFSEIRFLADVNKDNTHGIDLPFYVASHEVAHLWWGGQVNPANALGSRMLTESLAEYVSLKTLNNQFSKEVAQNYLNKYMDVYMKKRNSDSSNEHPLIHTKGKKHIAYVKGSLAFNTLSHYLGEDKLNKTLSDFVESVRFKGPPYSTSIDLIDRIKETTPDSLKYIIEDLFESVTLYENTIQNVDLTSTGQGSYLVDLKFTISKFRNSHKGTRDYGLDSEILRYNPLRGEKNILSLPLSDYIEIVVFDKNQNPIYSHKHKITQIDNQISIILNEEPYEIGLDPFNYLINTNFRNNRVKL